MTEKKIKEAKPEESILTDPDDPTRVWRITIDNNKITSMFEIRKDEVSEKIPIS